MNFSAIPAQSFTGRLLRWPLRLIPGSVPMPVLQGPLRGMRWIAGAANHSCWLGCYEPNKQRELEARVHPGDVVYDLGANAGYFSLMASVLTGSAGRVVSFEPLPENVAVLRRHLELNGVRNCTVVEAAVSSCEGLSRFSLGHSGSMGHLDRGHLDRGHPDRGHPDDAEGGIEVRVVTLDGLVARGEIPPPASIKCDIEDGESEALRGAEAVLRTWHPTILLDLHSREAATFCSEFLAGLGYEVTALDRRPLDDSSEILAVWRENLERTAQPSQPVF